MLTDSAWLTRYSEVILPSFRSRGPQLESRPLSLSDVTDRYWLQPEIQPVEQVARNVEIVRDQQHAEKS